ncbi:MAG: DUF4345 family protein [Gammaproteobacteria bacterium]|nr:DUF4345 family protein [Gammaproteobacteria bacterium]
MKLLLKLLIASIGLLYLLIWLRLMTDPAAMLEQFALVPQGIAGLNSLRANVGVLFLAGTLFCFLSLRANGRWWLLPAAALTAGAALGRLIGMAMDGIARESMTGLIFELVIVAIFLLAYRVLGGAVSPCGT